MPFRTIARLFSLCFGKDHWMTVTVILSLCLGGSAPTLTVCSVPSAPPLEFAGSLAEAAGFLQTAPLSSTRLLPVHPAGVKAV